jgi:FtsH-binding integral membrane protein
MSDFNRGVARPWAAGQADMAVDSGLRAFMLGVYNKLALGLVLSGVLAFACSVQPIAGYLYVTTPEGVPAGFTALGAALRFAPLILIFGSMFFMRNPSPRSAGILYWTFVSIMGAGLSIWLVAYPVISVARIFFITAAAFGGLSLVGYTTKKDLSGMGSFVIMGLWGIVIASFVNLFLHSSGMAFIISILGVLIFSGLIAYDTQRLKMTYYQLGGDQAAMGVATNYGALSLYLDFINLFQFLMMLFGGGSRR